MHKTERLVNEAMRRYGLISDGDRILVGLSGGKDSMALLELLARRSRIFVPRFEVEAAYVRMTNIPYQADEQYLSDFADSVGVRLHVVETSFDAATDHRHTHCFLCSWQRRKMLFETAKKLKCNKIALGHHRDDIIQTALLNLTFQGQFAAMQPMMPMDRFPITIIRPLCLLRESDLLAWAGEHNYRQLLRQCPYEDASRRHDMKALIAQLEQMNPEFAFTFYRAIERTFKKTE